MTNQLRQVATAILENAASHDKIVRKDFLAHRVGRNRVWKIVGLNDSPILFAKFYPNRVDYRRELQGLELAERIAVNSQQFMSANIVLADEEYGFIVTESLGDRSFGEILRRAYRFDMNPFGKARAVEQASQCLDLIVRWLDILHSQPVYQSEDLRDHTTAGIRTRIDKKIQRIVTMKIPSLTRTLRQASVLTDLLELNARDESRMVFGDASPANFIFDGNRLGVIDFEEFGFGNPALDRFELELHLQRVDTQWHYRSCEKLRNDITLCDTADTSMYELEFSLVQVVNHALLEGRPSSTPPLSKAIDRLKKCVKEQMSKARLGKRLTQPTEATISILRSSEDTVSD